MSLGKVRKFFHYLLYMARALLRGYREEDRQVAFEVLTNLGQRLLPRYRFTWSEISWMSDPDFVSYLERFGESKVHNSHRRWMLRQLARLTYRVDGDTVECGAYLGADSWLILLANANSGQNKMHHVFDSFEGLSDPGPIDGGYWKKGALNATMDEVEKNLKPFVKDKAYRLYKGWIPDRFQEIGDRRFSFVHVDVDLYQPTADSIEFFYDRMSEGGIFVCDDYGFDTCPGATKAVDEYLSDKREKMLFLPDGGGFFIKGVPTEDYFLGQTAPQVGTGRDSTQGGASKLP